MKKTDKKVICELLGISDKSYYRWREERKIFPLLEKYFKKEDLEEFLETGKIKKLEKLNTIQYLEQFVRDLDHKINIERVEMIIDEFNNHNSENKIYPTVDSVFSDFYNFLEASELSEFIDYLQLDTFKKFNIEKFKLYLLSSVHRLSNIEFYIYCGTVYFDKKEYKEDNADFPLYIGFEDYIEECLPDNPLVDN